MCEVPFIACQRMNSKDGAARIFARAFFTELRRSNDLPRAYGMARDAVERRTTAGQLASGVPSNVPQYVLCHPRRTVPAPQVAAGIPVLLTAGGEET